jgi:hypothetical protein
MPHTGLINVFSNREHWLNEYKGVYR